jgi:predicted RNA methylase
VLLLFIAPFVSSPVAVIRRLLTLAVLKPKEIFFDLGSGDGGPIFIAAQEFGARSIGIELREDLVKLIKEKILKSDFKENVEIFNQDIFDVNLCNADVIYIYLTTSANEIIRPKLESELKNGARVVSHDYEIVEWKATKIEHFCENSKLGFPTHTLFLYQR